jgi:cytochrome d ubiquinol oxidase subunit II
MIAATVGAILLAAITAYAIFGGADFGGGLWDLLAGGDVRGRAPRRLIEESIAPVWEANHVWLVFALVIFWTGFPVAFSAVMNTATVPLWLALFGVVLRGIGLAFRKETSRLSLQRVFGAMFAFSSLLTPFFMGTVIGAIAAGSVPANATHLSLSAWTRATSLLIGFLFVSTCAYLAAVYLIEEAARRDDDPLRRYFTLRAIVAGVVTGALSLATLLELHASNQALFNRLTGRALPFVVLAGVIGLVVLGLLASGRRQGLRVLSALGVALVVWGWGVAQYPAVLPGTSVTLGNAGAPSSTLVALVAIFVLAVLLVLPSFALLFSMQGRLLLRGDGPTILAADPLSAATSSTGDQRGPSDKPGPGGWLTLLGLLAAGAIGRARERRRQRR